MNKEEIVNEVMGSFKMTVDTNGIKKLEEYIDNLEQENKLLREKLKATNKGLRKVLSKRLKWKRRYYKEKYIRKTLKKWLEEESDKTHISMYNIVAYSQTLDKIKELEEGVK